MITVDEPSLSVTIGINTSPLAGKDGSKLTARQVRDRLDQELVGNVSLRVHDTERPDAWEVQGRGELQLAVLVELMRREGFELTVGQPQVLTREIDGKVHEPVERLAIDVPEDYVGVVTQLLALRKGRMEQMVNHGTGWVRMEYLVPARGLIGFRTEFLTETRGTGLLHHVFDRWEPWAGELRTRPTGSLVADRRGTAAQFALMNLQERGTMFVGPGEEVYEGMIVGENARADDLDVNAVKEKHLTNIRSSTSDVLVRLVPAPPAVARPGARVPARGRVRRGHAGAPCGCARSRWTRSRARSSRASSRPAPRRDAGPAGAPGRRGRHERRRRRPPLRGRRRPLAFVVAGLALAGLAWVISFTTEQVGEHFGPAVTGVLQSTLGNLPEFFVVVFALRPRRGDRRPVLDHRVDLRQRAARARLRDRRRRAPERGRRDALLAAAAERHDDAAAAVRLHHRARRDLGRDARQGERQHRDDLGDHRRRSS